jgi:chitin disaccharide deacetylase
MTERRAGPLIVLHVDDVGMCHGANLAFLELSRAGRCDAGSVMVPCPWFLEIADWVAREPSLDLGVHLTLNAEKVHYRWRPLTSAGASSGLVDDDGYLWRSVTDLRRYAHPEAVEAELRAQIDAALAAGIDVTHLDDHMGAVFVPEFIEIYVRLGRDYDLPILFPRTMAAYGPIHNLPGALDERLHERLAGELEAQGALVADLVLETPWHRDVPVEKRYGDLFGKVGDGFTFAALHPNCPGEIEAIEPDTAAIRIEEYDMLAGPIGARLVETLPAKRIGMRELRDNGRAARAGAAPAMT